MPKNGVRLNSEGRGIRSTPFYETLRAAILKQAKEQGGSKWDATGVTDALANIMHICDESGLDFAECESRARNHYLCEIEIPEESNA